MLYHMSPAHKGCDIGLTGVARTMSVMRYFANKLVWSAKPLFFQDIKNILFQRREKEQKRSNKELDEERICGQMQDASTGKGN